MVRPQKQHLAEVLLARFDWLKRRLGKAKKGGDGHEVSLQADDSTR